MRAWHTGHGAYTPATVRQIPRQFPARPSTMFSTATQNWFDASFARATEIQRRGWPVIGSGAHALLVAPTGSGKTLAAFLWAIDRLACADAGSELGVRALYVSPLKALVYDIERNLRAPLVGIRRAAERCGSAFPGITVAVRTGDTPQRERQRQLRAPAEILVTTPESLFLLLGSRARETLRTVHTVIVDEVHALAPSKRGAHLALSLERLADLAGADPQRIGLSATVRPIDAVARYLGGDRVVECVDASTPPRLDVQVTVPVPDMTRAATAPAGDEPDGSILGTLYAREVGSAQAERGMWAAVYPKLLESIRAHRSTIVFVNSRGLCERLAHRLNELADEELVMAHHGSLSHAQRAEIEDRLKRGALRAIVATSSLELGVDMGAVDLVVLVESPGSVARGLQRVGRAGHQVDAVSVGRLFPKFRGDLLECAVIAARMRGGQLEALRVPRNSLDVLAQQIVAMCCERPRSVADIERVVRRSYPYASLSTNALEAVLDMLDGRYPSSEMAELRPLLAWDRSQNVLSARRGAAMISRMNAGTIPDRGSYGVFLGADGPRVGELDEEMVFETRVGENITLGAASWRIEDITRDRVIVQPAPGEPGRLPFWRGDGPGRSLELGRAIGAFVRALGAMAPEAAVPWLLEQAPLDRFAAQNLAAYVAEQKHHTGTLPTDRDVTVERFRDELGDWRVCILTPFGARVHAPWAMALQHRLAARVGADVQLMYTDDGIVLRFADTDELPGVDELCPDPENVEELVTEQLANSSLFAGLFRENAARALLLPRRQPERRRPLWAQRLKAQQLLATVKQYASFPIVLETYRQALSDTFDLDALKVVLRDIRSRRVRLHDIETRSASPFARSLVFAYVAAYIYEQDAPLPERKAQALTLDRNLLSELLGQEQLRELIDRDVLAELEAELQHLVDERRAGDADRLHDLLRRLGDLSEAELAERSTAAPGPWLVRLERERRAVQLAINGERRWIAAEDAGLMRDALGAVPPAGLPAQFLETVENPLAELVRRFARRRGPFLSGDVRARFGLTPAQLEPVLEGLERAGVLVRGEIRPDGAELDWCDAEILRRLKRRTLARLRDQVAPVDGRALGLFLTRWHGVDGGGSGPERLLEAIAQLEGIALPWSVMVREILPRRVSDFRLEMLDALCASGAVVWAGQGALGARDGRVGLFLREHLAGLLAAQPPYAAATPLHATVVAHLAAHGASFAAELDGAVRASHAGVTAAELDAVMWDLVWEGVITNDTCAPLRALGGVRAGTRTRRGRSHAFAGGRWSLLRGALAAPVSDTERLLMRANVLLERYGIVSREAVRAEDMEGGFTSLYRVLRSMEEAGRLRRGYFVDGLAGAQFGYAGAIDLLRAARADIEDDADAALAPVVLAAADPANPYGSLLPWPDTGGEGELRPRRIAGARVILLGGLPRLYVGPRGRQLLTFGAAGTEQLHALERCLRALHALPQGARRGMLVIEKIDGEPVRQSPLCDLLAQCGFASDYRGMVAVGA